MYHLLHRRAIVGEDRCAGWRCREADLRRGAAGNLGEQGMIERRQVGAEVRQGLGRRVATTMLLPSGLPLSGSSTMYTLGKTCCIVAAIASTRL